MASANGAAFLGCPGTAPCLASLCDSCPCPSLPPLCTPEQSHPWGPGVPGCSDLSLLLSPQDFWGLEPESLPWTPLCWSPESLLGVSWVLPFSYQKRGAGGAELSSPGLSRVGPALPSHTPSSFLQGLHLPALAESPGRGQRRCGEVQRALCLGTGATPFQLHGLAGSRCSNSFEPRFPHLPSVVLS